MARKKTERIYTPVESMSHFARKIALFNDKIAFRWLNKQHEILSMTYRELSERIRRQAAGFSAAGLAGKRIAVIGETSVEWVTTYVAAIAAGGVAIPLDRELDAKEIEGFLTFAEADAIVFSAGMNAKLAPLAEGHPTVSKVIPVLPDAAWEENPRVLPFEKLMEMGVSMPPHQASQITRDDYDEYDCIIGMDSNNTEIETEASLRDRLPCDLVPERSRRALQL